MYRCDLIYCKMLATWIYVLWRLNFTNIGSEVYNVCAGLVLNSVGLKVGVVVCRQRCIVNSYGKH